MTLPLKTLVILFASFVVLLGGVGYAAVYFYQQSQANQQAAEFAAAVGRQNEQALQQQLLQKADSIQNLALQVQSLNKDKQALQKKNKLYIAMTESLQIVIKNISVSGSGTASDGTDSVGTYGEVSFSGKKSFIRYSGFTRRYADKSSYRLDLFPDNIDIYGDVIRDVDNIWKIRIRSGTEGVTLKVYSTLDSNLFHQATVPPATSTKADALFSLYVNAGVRAGLDGALAFAPSVGTVYQRRYFVQYYPLQKSFQGGIKITLLEF